MADVEIYGMNPLTNIRLSMNKLREAYSGYQQKSKVSVRETISLCNEAQHYLDMAKYLLEKENDTTK